MSLKENAGKYTNCFQHIEHNFTILKQDTWNLYQHAYSYKCVFVYIFGFCEQSSVLDCSYQVSNILIVKFNRLKLLISVVRPGSKFYILQDAA